MKPRVFYLLQQYPQTSETYIKSEIEALSDTYDIHVVATKEANLAYQNHGPYRIQSNYESLRAVVREWQPVVLHGHWLHMVPVLHSLSQDCGMPWTLRAHSFDVLSRPEKTGWIRSLTARVRRTPDPTQTRPRQCAPLINQPNCLGVLTFPFTRPILEQAGIRGEKIVEAYPVINYRRFLDRGPNGNDIMNVGACIPKKKMRDFIDLANLMPDRQFRLYPIGYQRQDILDYNRGRGSPVEMMPALEPDAMPAEYKKHQWLVYTADARYNTVGWPLALAEAQASGVGVCMADIRPDLADYLGGAGFLFKDIHEARKIVSQPVPEEIRELGFLQAQKSDIQTHRHLLTELWTRPRLRSE